MIEVDKLSRYFGQFCAVKDLSFVVKPGEVLGFLGPNGAGKSTTMKMITGFLEPSQGQIRVSGFDIQTQPSLARRSLGYLPEGAPCYGDMSVNAFLNFMGQMRELNRAKLQQRQDYVIQRLQLGEVINKPIETLSKGFKRRVGLAQAILHDPKVLILDEPTDGLDPNQKHEVRSLIQEMAQDKLIIISTHILEEVTAVCSRAMIIARGQKVFDGTPAELQARSRYHGSVQLALSEARDAQPSLLALAGVLTVEANADNTVFVVVAQPGQVIFERVAELCRRCQWPVAQLFAQTGQLDDVFRSLTSEAA